VSPISHIILPVPFYLFPDELLNSFASSILPSTITVLELMSSFLNGFGIKDTLLFRGETRTSKAFARLPFPDEGPLSAMCSQSPGYSQPNKTHVYSRDITTRRILCASKHIYTHCARSFHLRVKAPFRLGETQKDETRSHGGSQLAPREQSLTLAVERGDGRKERERDDSISIEKTWLIWRISVCLYAPPCRLLSISSSSQR